MSSAPYLSIVMLSWNTRELTLAALRALERDPSTRTREVIVVDNASSDGSVDAIAAQFPHVRLIRNDRNELYAEGNNQGARIATGEFLCLLNSDTEVVPGALEMLVEFLEKHPDYGAVSPQLRSFDGSIQRACTRFPGLFDPLVDSTLFGRFWPGTHVHGRTRMHDFDHAHSRDVDQPPGAVFLIRRAEYLALGGLDPDLSLFYNDVDLCKRLWKRGRRIHYLAEARVFHHQGASTSRSERVQSLWLQNRRAYYAKHYGLLGSGWLRIVHWLWLAQIACGVVLGPRALKEKARALRDLGGKVWA